MGKGKKKGGRATTSTATIEEATSALSLEESQPSTSQPVPTPTVKEEEEEGGLGLTGGKRNKKSKAKSEEKEKAPAATSAPSAQAAPSAQHAPSASTAPSEQPAELPKPVELPKPSDKEPEEDAGLGLGKPKRVRKKKPSLAVLEAQKAKEKDEGPQKPAMQPLGAPTAGTPQQSAMPPQPWGAAPPLAGPRQPPAMPPQTWEAPKPTAGPRQPPAMPPQPWEAPKPTAAQPGRAGPIQPTQAAGDAKHATPAPRSKREMVCKYAIPAKIIGNRVPCHKVMITTNYLPMTIKPLKVHRYDFQFIPDKPKKMIPQVYQIFKQAVLPKEVMAFDMFKNAYCLNVLDRNIVEDVKNKESRREHKVELKDPNGRIMNFTVSMKYTGFVDFAKVIRHMETAGGSLSFPQEEVQAMDVVLRQGTLESYVKCGRNFFKRPDRPINLTGGLEMWTGLFQSAIFTSRPYINIDVAHKGFPIHQPLTDAYKSFNVDFNRPLEQQQGFDVERFKDFVKNLRVKCKLIGGGEREFIINSVKENSKQVYFEKDDGQKLSVYDYFLKEKRYKIQNPQLPCFWVGPRNKTIFYPMELCTVSYGQAIRKQLTEKQLSTMVREAATPPHERKRKIEEVARNMNYSQNPYFKKFGLEISNQFLQVEAKVLRPPSLSTGENRSAVPRNGAWISNKLLQPEALISWGFFGIELDPNACNYNNVKRMIMENAVNMGMKVNEPKMVAFNVTMRDLRTQLFKAAADNIRLVFIIVPFRGRDYYHKVKQHAETDVGILTQCIKDGTTNRFNPQCAKNILLKVNSKLMGINQCLDNYSVPHCIQNGSVMIVGADVTHPSPDQQNIPSIAAVTASMDPKCFIYNIELSIQSPKAEVIKEFAEIMYDHLKVYVQRNGTPPKKIYVFRDGVSEGQFGQVMNEELTGLFRAYERFSKQKPEVLFLLVQKRHHTRMFGTHPQTKQIVNVEPGTVVDTHIVHPKELDFYLVSHQAIKGTARPTRYHSVCNDGNIPHDEVEQLTYYLCHLYSRCMRSVSYPTPTYYAHLACLRARSLTYGRTFDNSELEMKPRRLQVMEKMLRSSRMFFV